MSDENKASTYIEVHLERVLSTVDLCERLNKLNHPVAFRIIEKLLKGIEGYFEEGGDTK